MWWEFWKWNEAAQAVEFDRYIKAEAGTDLCARRMATLVEDNAMSDDSVIYRKMHERRFDAIEEKRRARNYQADLAGIVCLIRETSQRYSRGSVTRVAMDNLILEISERFPAASKAMLDEEG